MGKLCKRCNAQTQDGTRCHRRVSCREGKQRTRCSSHKRAPKYSRSRRSSAKSPVRRSSRHSSEYSRPSDWPNKRFPDNGAFPKSPKEFPRQKPWLNLTNRLYNNVSCDRLARENPDQCRYHYKCTNDCDTRVGYPEKWFQKYDKNPLGF